MSKKVEYNATCAERTIISRIARRAIKLDGSDDNRNSFIDWQMDITACHSNGCPLRLKELAKADDFNFAHDVFGIAKHLNRNTGQLGNHFSPRYHV